MDREVISAKLETLRRCVQRIKDKTPASAAVLLEDYDLQDIICINLERLVQTCVDLASHIIAESDLPAPGSMSEAFERLRQLKLIPDELAARLTKAVGFRNVAVHAYREMDWEIVYGIITTRLADFVDFARAVARAAELP
ncbi:MAG: hypothetical protein DMG07_28335 [Acidobacteria bacterium]|nr:MAG: hypothetical protein DMG07_28335 [Acidobacteriota bacterium]